MLVNLYKAKTPLSVFSLPLIAGVMCLSIFYRDAEETIFFFKWQTDFFVEIREISWLNFLLSVFVISLNANQLNLVFNRNSFYSKDTYLPGFIYVIGLATFESIEFSPLLLAHLFLIGAMASLLQLKRQESGKNLVFLGSVSLGILILFSPLLIVLALLPWLVLLIVKPFDWREWVVAFLGITLPTFYHYAVNYLITGNIRIDRMDVVLTSPDVVWTISQSILYLTASIVILISLYRFLIIMRSQIVNFKKISQITLLILFLCVLSFLAGWYFFNQFYVTFLLPLGYVVSVHILYGDRALVTNVLVMIWFLTAMINLYL